MLKRIAILGLLALALTVSACGSEQGGDPDPPNAAPTGSTGVTLNEGYAGALAVSSQLAIGTLMLEETQDAVTVEQAGELLASWQMLEALQSSGTAAQAELDAVLDQIQRGMTSEQLMAIKEMQLTADSMTGLVQEQGLGRGLSAGAGGFRPPAGVMPAGGGGRGDGLGVGENPSPEEQEAAIAERMNRFAGSALTGLVVSLLEARAEGEIWQVAAPDQDFEIQRALLSAVAQATGLDQQEITAQTREGATLREIAEASAADLDQIVALVVTAETERVNQAVADGSLEQADAGDWLIDLEARVKALLDGTLQFGARGARDGAFGQP